MKLVSLYLRHISWGLTFVVVMLAVIAWGQGIRWEFSALSNYQLFPLFGLLAFSIMWSHYVAGALRRYANQSKATLKKYFETTSLVVLISILLHPGLLIWQLWRDGQGLPPSSTLGFVSESLKIAIISGMIGLVVFLFYELHRWFSDKSWWRHVQYASDLAMMLIFIHALRLGGHLSGGWYRTVWYFYGATLLFSIIYSNYANRGRNAIAKS